MKNPDLLERSLELLAIDELLAGIQAGAGGLLVIEGAAGMGKSRLLTEAARRAGGAGVAVRSVSGDYLERSFAWHGAAELLGETLRAPQGEGEEAALDLLRALAASVARLARERPQLLLLDDAHWLDAPTLRLAHFLAGRLEHVAAGVVLALRPGEASAADGLILQAIAAHPAGRRISLTSLSPASVEKLVRSRLGKATPADFCGRCAQLTGGNPFYLHELLRSLPAGLEQPGPDILDGIAPPTLARSTLIRLARLGPGAAEVAKALAILGDGAPTRHVAALGSLSIEQALSETDALEAADLLCSEPRLRFAHPLIRSVLEADMLPGARASAHARAASLLASESAPAEAIAAHLLLAPAGLIPEATVTLREAAARAVTNGAPASAVTYLERAVEEPGDAQERAAVRLELAEAAVAAGSPRAVAHLERALADVRDAPARARIRLALGWALHAAGRFADAASAFDAGIADAPASDEQLLVELRTGRMTAGMLDAGRAAETHELLQSLSGLPAPRDAAERHYQSQLLVLALFSGETHAQTLAEFAEAQLLGLGAGADRIHDWTRWNLIGTLSWCDRFDVVLAQLDPLVGGEGALRVAMASYARSWPSLWTGRVAQAAEDARRAVDLWTAGAETYLPAAAFWLVSALCELGQLERAEATLEEIDAERWRGTAFFVFILAAQGRVAGATGKLERSLERWQACGAYFSEVMHASNPTLLPWRSEAAILAARLRDGELARSLAVEELARAEVFGAPRAIGAALRASAAASGGEEGIAALERACTILCASGAVLEHAHALVDLGAALRRAGSRARARGPLREGLAIAERCGALTLGRRAAEELSASGAHCSSASRDILTPSERRIAELAAAGLSNREIAARLFVTVKAVEFHLSRVFSKLEVRGRKELAGALLPAVAAEL